MKPLLTILAFTLCLTAFAGGAPGKSADEGEHVHRSWSDVDHWKTVFDDEARRRWQKPLVVLDLLGIQRGDTVVDLGAGTGYFTGLLSMKVGETGKVYAVDIEQAMLDHLKQRGDAKQGRIFPILAGAKDPRLPEGEADLVLTVNTWHHIENRSKYLRKLARGLSPEGRVVVIDFHEGQLPVGPPAGQKLSRETLIGEFEDAGWKTVSESIALPYQYFITFHPPRKKPPTPFARR